MENSKCHLNPFFDNISAILIILNNIIVVVVVSDQDNKVKKSFYFRFSFNKYWN